MSCMRETRRVEQSQRGVSLCRALTLLKSAVSSLVGYEARVIKMISLRIKRRGEGGLWGKGRRNGVRELQDEMEKMI